MKGRMKPYLPELTIRDYNIYLQYLRGVRRQLYTEFGWYSCHLLRYNGVVFAILSDSLGRACGHLPASAGAGHPVLAQDDVPDAGHPAGGTGGSAAGLAQPAGPAAG